MGNIGCSPTDNNWYYQSFFADTDFIHLYLYTIIVTLVLFYWNVTKFEVSEPFTETEKFVTF